MGSEITNMITKAPAGKVPPSDWKYLTHEPDGLAQGKIQYEQHQRVWPITKGQRPASHWRFILRVQLVYSLMGSISTQVRLCRAPIVSEKNGEEEEEKIG